MGAQTGDGDVAVGDVVNVPGDMHGTVRFIGSVKGKAGVFAGVELSKEFAHRGKNDGDVDGLRYFTTSVPHSGIFLPVGRATKRHSATSALSATTPLATATGSTRPNSDGSGTLLSPATVVYTPPATAVTKLSQSVGPGRAASPLFRPKARPSLPRPESPLRRQQNTGATSGRPSLGASIASGRPGGAGASSRYAPSPIPGKAPAGATATAAAGTLRPKRNSNTFSGDPVRTRFPTTTTGRPATKTGPGVGARSESALGDRSTHDSGWAAGTSANGPLTRSSNGSYTSSSGYGTKATSAYSDDDVVSLRQKLEERDQRLKEQAASLAEMEQSLAELQSLINTTRSEQQSAASGSGADAAADDVAQLRALLREKNEKITMLTAEFDAHRADFRSTIDTLELASTETERVYEKRVEELLQDIRELQDRSEDVEIVARQLKQLEELVQELEEGLEDARRGEAEARSEVEFLRGEVERGRSELKREREKAAAALKAAGAAAGVNGNAPSAAAAAAAAAALDGYKEVEQRDDEIRGLKAIIHSLSRDSVPDTTMPHFDGNGGVSGAGGGRSLAGRNGSIVSSSSATAAAAAVSAESHRRLSQQVLEEKAVRDRLEHEIRELRGLVERKLHREGELEREIERLRRGRSRAGERKSGSSEHTITLPKRMSEDAGGGGGGGIDGVVAFDRRRDALLPSPSSGLGAGAVGGNSGRLGGLSQPQLETMHESDTTYSSDADGSALWCEICETGGHDILTCTNVFGHQKSSASEPHDTSTHATPVVMNNGFVTTPAGAAAGAAAAAMSPATITTTTAPATPTINAGAFADAAPSPLSGGQQRTGRDVVVQGLKGLAIAPLPHQQHQYLNQSHHQYRQGGGGDDSGTADLSSVSGSVSPAPPAHPPPPPADLARTAAAGAAERANSAASPQLSTASSSSSPLLPQGQPQQQQQQQQQQPRPIMPDPADSGLVPGKASGVVDPNKWCALCERDGHESVDCPFEEGL